MGKEPIVIDHRLVYTVRKEIYHHNKRRGTGKRKVLEHGILAKKFYRGLVLEKYKSNRNVANGKCMYTVTSTHADSSAADNGKQELLRELDEYKQAVEKGQVKLFTPREYDQKDTSKDKLEYIHTDIEATTEIPPGTPPVITVSPPDRTEQFNLRVENAVQTLERTFASYRRQRNDIESDQDLARACLELRNVFFEMTNYDKFLLPKPAKKRAAVQPSGKDESFHISAAGMISWLKKHQKIVV